MPLGHNRVLGEQSRPAEARPHRVVLANWPATIEDPRTETFESVLNHVASHGYEGIEFSLDAIGKYFPGDSKAVMARKVGRAVSEMGLEFVGSTLHRTDAQARARRWLGRFVDDAKLVQDAGGAFASVQFFLDEDYLNTGGAYRDDDEYLEWCADCVTQMRDAAWGLGMNFYLEVHIDRITEDPAACCRILDLATCELNGDMSHYLARGFLRGKHVERVLAHVGHTHVRLARKLGDLSAAAEDPAADWAEGGVTWQLFDFMKPALDGGLSSRTIAGESGPLHLVTDPLTQDALLVPLWRAMARYADAAAQGIALPISSPDDLKPWG